MPFYRRFFPTLVEAQAAAVQGIANLKAQYTAAASETFEGEAAGGASIGPAPAMRIQVLSIEDLPAGAVAGSVPYSRVRWQITTPDGRSSRPQSIMPTAQINPSTGGTIQVSTLTPATVTVKLSVAAQIYVYRTYTGQLIPSGAQFQDPATGKTYQIGTGSTALAIFAVTEVNPSDLGEVTQGTRLNTIPSSWSTPDDAKGVYAQVIAMAGETIADGTVLTDPATSLEYKVKGLQTISAGSGGLTGDVTAAIPIVGQVPGSNSVKAGTGLQWSTKPAGVSATVSTKTEVLVTIPAGTVFRDPLGGTYTNATDEAIGDALAANFLVAPPATAVETHLEAGTVLTMPLPPPGVDVVTNPPICIAGREAPTFPFDYQSHAIGGAMSFGSYVQRELDGRYSANVFTLPIGT